MRRTVFYVSDGTGITAQTIGHSILTQFAGVEFTEVLLPYIDDREKAEAAVQRMKAAAQPGEGLPIVVSTVVHVDVKRVIEASGLFVLDAITPFIEPLERELGAPRQPRVGQGHAMVDPRAYEARINATNYALSHDDGMVTNFAEADVVLVGVSRSGKTPTCLYMALQFGVHAANYPLTDEDLSATRLPRHLEPCRGRMFGLTIDAVRLQQIREARRSGSTYASLEQCKRELDAAVRMFKREQIPYTDSTHTSIEELASKVRAWLEGERIARRQA